MNITSRPVQECTFTTHDGVALFYRHWPARHAARRGAIVLLHRGHGEEDLYLAPHAHPTDTAP
jgi:alpha-beta hydrolase superfamily lysophospholipase